MPSVLGPNGFISDAAIISDGVTIGRLVTEVEAAAVYDTRNNKTVLRYNVTCRHRFVLPSQSTGTLNEDAPDQYSDYPVLVTTTLRPSWSDPPDDNGGDDGDDSVAGGTADSTPSIDSIQLLDYQPRTMNTVVSTDTNNAGEDSSSSTNSRQSSLGSSYSQTNSHSSSLSLSKMPSLDFGHDRSSTKGVDAGLQSGRSDSSGDDSSLGLTGSMSFKEWGAYSSVDPNNQAPSWAFGQEYPWNVFDYRYVDTSEGPDTTITLPQFMIDRMYYDKVVLPPSDLSLFGVDFTTIARWIVTPPETSVEGETLYFGATLAEYLGTHGLDDGTFSVSFSGQNIDDPASFGVNLPLLALEPIVGEGAEAGAMIGFALDKFACGPSTSDGFRIHSGLNNLIVTGKGFEHPQIGSDKRYGLQADLADGKEASFKVYFKVIETEAELVLFARCWRVEGPGVHLKFDINGILSFYQYVDSGVAEAGSDNVLTITLRQKDFSSYEFFDYLKIGLNEIDVTVTCSDNKAKSSKFVLHSIAIG
ncbi:MAG: hypothetical protein NXI16_04705 [Alphaproteobacteria bacterium]|nr:hypothetical protein [Alphaproteobacteria bacterium]